LLQKTAHIIKEIEAFVWGFYGILPRKAGGLFPGALDKAPRLNRHF
jgi:hypothetical protein